MYVSITRFLPTLLAGRHFHEPGMISVRIKLLTPNEAFILSYFLLFCPWLKCKAILPIFPFTYGFSLLTKDYIGIEQKVESDWGRQAASSWHLLTSFHLPFWITAFPQWHVPWSRIKAGPLVGSTLYIQPAHPSGCSCFRSQR